MTWATSDATTITTGGVVTRKESGDVQVTLTATLKIGSLTETKQFTLIVKQYIPAPTTYTITYNLNGGQLSSNSYGSKGEMATAFLTDLYAFVNPSENLTTFMHGAGNTSGFNGLWHSNHQNQIYAGPKPTTVNNAYFASAYLYMKKWEPFFDMMDDIIKKINSTQYFWGESTYTGLIRIKEFATKDPNRQPYYDQVAAWP